MRTHSVAEANLARADALNYHVIFEVRNPDDTAWVDLSTFLLTADWGRDGDQAVMDGIVELLRETSPANSLAPYMGASLLNRNDVNGYAPLLKPNRRVRLRTAITAPNVAPIATDWREVFIGVIDDADSAVDDNVRIAMRDIGALLLDRQIESPQQYGSATGVALEDVLQSMLNANGFSSVLLYTPASPGWMVNTFEITDGSLLDNMRSIAQQIGWDVRYEFDGADAFRLTLLEPNRETSTPAAATFGPDDYEKVDRFLESGAGIRTVVRVDYMHESGVRDDVQVEADAATIAAYGRKLMIVPVEATFNIHTVADATALANAILNDVSRPLADKGLLMFYWPYVQVGDVYTFLANDVHYDSNQTMYVFGYRHSAAQGHVETRLTVGGTPVGIFKTWHRRADTPELAPGLAPVIEIRIVSATRDEQQVEVTARNPTGFGVQLETSLGGAAFIVRGSGATPQTFVETLPRSVESENKLLVVRATSLDTGLVTEIPYVADWDFLPEVVSYNVRPLLDVGGEQVGFVVDASVDDDTNSLVVDLESGTFTIQPPATHDTTALKTTSNDVLQDIGQEGILRLRPFAGVGGTGVEGKTTRVSLLRTPVSSVTTRDLSTTELEVMISANPATAAIYHRHYTQGDTPPAWAVANPGPVTIRIARHSTADVVLEYYAKQANVAPEPRRRLIIDPDQSADVEISSIVATGNRVVISADVGDEDIVRYEVYAKLAGWPTIDGLVTGTLAPECLRASKNRDDATTPMHATDGDWYFILVAYDFAGKAGVRASQGPVTVDGAAANPPGTLLWANVYVAEPTPGNEVHHVSWGKDGNVTLDYDVEIWERATIKGVPGSFALLATVNALDPFYDADSFTDHDPPSGGFFCEWEYRLDLYHNVNGYIMSVTTTISGYYLP